MRLHGALCSIPISLICNMSTFSNKKGLTPPQGSMAQPQGSMAPPKGSMVCVRTELRYAPLPLI